MRLVAASLALSAVPFVLLAQTPVTPGSHWGANMLPDLDYRVDAAIHFVGFTRFGKEFVPNTRQFTFRPYNDITNTLGFNILSVTRTAPNKPFPVTESLVQVRTSYAAGIVNDHITEFLQNDLAHWCKRCGPTLPRVPREIGDTETKTSYGKTDEWPILQFSQEFFFRPPDHDRVGGNVRTKPSDVFAGGGYSVGTVNHEAFLHLGTNPRGIEFDKGASCLLWVFCLTRLNVGGIARVGVLAPSHHIKDVTSGFSAMQGVLHTRLAINGFPVIVEGALTSHLGLFAEPRTPQDRVIVAERDDLAESLYHIKRAKHERFISYRLRMGGFTFEYVNDEPGGKDKGPTYGVTAGFDFSRTDYSACRMRQFFTFDEKRSWYGAPFAYLRRKLECF